jgi:hypothetical protein
MTIDIGTFVGLGGVPVVIALVQAFKGYVRDKRAWPFIAIFLGVLWCVIVRLASSGDIKQAAVEGVIVGLLASGLFSQTKAVRGE